MRSDCPICAKHRDLNTSPLFHGQNWRVETGNIEAGVKGYIYLEPLRHVEHWSDLTQEELLEMSLLIPQIERALRQLLPVERMYIVVISEAVRHIHLHIIPRLQDDQEKGIPLITRATQHRSETDLQTQKEYDEFYRNLKKILNQ